MKKKIIQEVISSSFLVGQIRENITHYIEMTDIPTTEAGITMPSNTSQTVLTMDYMLNNIDNFFLIVNGSIIILMQVLPSFSS